MASILDSLFFGSQAPETGVPTPTPNPLRLPPPAPSIGGVGSLLSSLFQAPELAALLPGSGLETDAQRKIKGQQRDAEARQYYNSPGVQMPLPEKRNGANPSNEGGAGAASGEDGAASDDEEDDETPPLPERNPLTAPPAGQNGGGVRGPDGSLRVPFTPPPPVADPLKAMMLQIGLNLMTPQWGDGISQIGQALGGGMAAGGRANQLNDANTRRAEADADKDADRSLRARKINADIEHTEAQTEDLKTGESSRSRRLRGKQPTVIDEAAAAAGLGAKGKAYLATRIKTLNKDDLLGTEDTDPVAKFNQILEEAKKLDAPSAPAKVPNVGGTETATSLPIMKTPEEAKKLSSGTKFLFEDPKTKQLTIGTAP